MEALTLNSKIKEVINMKFSHSYEGLLYMAPTNEYMHYSRVSFDGLTSRLITKNDLKHEYMCDVEHKIWESKYDRY